MELIGTLLEVASQTDVADARRRTAAIASTLGFGETISGQAAIAVTEAATNLLKHAGRGELFVGINPGNVTGLQMVAMDRGRGIRNIPASLRDGVSTTGTAGNGLGAIRRLATTFDLYSVVGGGTVVSAGFYAQPNHLPPVAGLSMKSPLGAILVRTGVTGETGSQTGERGNGDERGGIGERCSEWLPAAARSAGRDW